MNLNELNFIKRKTAERRRLLITEYCMMEHLTLSISRKAGKLIYEQLSTKMSLWLKIKQKKKNTNNKSGRLCGT
jgi:hypothetical protein